MKLSFYAQNDDGGRIEHLHFDCPACGRKFAGTDMFCDISELIIEGIEKDGYFAFKCERCNAQFECTEKAKFPKHNDWVQILLGEPEI